MSEAAVSRNAGVAGLLSDDRLAKRATGGDRRAFAAIYQRYHQKLYRYCLATVGNPEDAQDALQNTMVKVLRSLPGEERRIELKPWLYRIAHNESIELLRRRRASEELDPETATHGPGLADEAAARERLRHLVADLDELPERQRGALVMRELAGLDFDEIGAALGTSQAVARQTLYEARLGLREMDAGRGMTCAEVTRALSDGDGRVLRRRDIRAHLRGCSSCRRFREEIDDRGRDLAALSPLPAAAAAGLLQGVLGSAGGSGGGGAFAALGAGAAKSVGAPAMLKSAAAVVAVAAVGVTAADRGGLIHLGADGQGGSQSIENGRPTTTDPSVAPVLRPGVEDAARAISKSHLAGRGVGQGHAGSAKAGAGGGAVTEVGTGQHPEPPEAPLAAPLPGNSAEAHTRGRGRSKQHPAASAHGQETAAAHKGAKGGGHAKSHPAHPGQPSHPAKPAHPPAPVKPGPTKEQSPAKAEDKTPPGSGSVTETPPEAEASPHAGKGR
jgi:RNA polymerase sigma factor (sigma-70 family)